VAVEDLVVETLIIRLVVVLAVMEDLVFILLQLQAVQVIHTQ